MTMLKCVWSLRPTFRIHISGAHRGARKNQFFSASCCIFNFFLVRCPYSPYDSVRISRETVYFRATLQNLRAKILCVPREKIPLRANRRMNLVSSRGPCIISRDLEKIFARDCQNFARSAKLLRADCQNFARNSATATLFSCIDFAYSLIFAANCSRFYPFVFSDFLEQHNSKLRQSLILWRTSNFLSKFSLAPMVSHHGLSS